MKHSHIHSPLHGEGLEFGFIPAQCYLFRRQTKKSELNFIKCKAEKEFCDQHAQTSANQSASHQHPSRNLNFHTIKRYHGIFSAIHSQHSSKRGQGMVEADAVYRRCEVWCYGWEGSVCFFLILSPHVIRSKPTATTRFGNRYFENLNAEEEIPGRFSTLKPWYMC